VLPFPLPTLCQRTTNRSEHPQKLLECRATGPVRRKQFFIV
jgi:hypothetical protein